MSIVKKPILLNDTGREMVRAMHTQNALLSAMARESINALTSWKDIQALVRQGLAKEIFQIGDQFIVPWKDVAADKTYDVPLDIVHFGDVELQDGEIVPAMFLQWHYATPFGVQFDAPEREIADGVFSTDYSYYKEINGSVTTYKLLTPGTDYNVGDTIPTSPVIVRTAIKDPRGDVCYSGYNRWSHSAIRQFLNSKAGKNAWWVAQHLGDVAPSQLATNAGFMTGFEDDFLSVVGPIKVTTVLNTTTDKDLGDTEDTYDTFFLPSLEQMYARPTLAGVEGDYFEYWKRATNRRWPNEWYSGNTNPGYFIYDIKAKTVPRDAWLRSAARSITYSAYYVDHRSYINAHGVSTVCHCTPVCAVY